MRDPLRSTPAGKPRARTLGIDPRGIPGAWNAITDVPGVEVGYPTLIEGERRPHRRHRDPCRAAATGTRDPCAAGCLLAQRQRRDDRRLPGSRSRAPLDCRSRSRTPTRSASPTRHGRPVDRSSTPPRLAELWLLPVAAETWDGYLNDINGGHVTRGARDRRDRGGRAAARSRRARSAAARG